MTSFFRLFGGGSLFGSDLVDNTVVLFFLSSLDSASTYLCISAGLYEANPVVRFLYDSVFPGLFSHLILNYLICLFVAYAAAYFFRLHSALGYGVLIVFAARSLLLAFNNFMILTTILL